MRANFIDDTECMPRKASRGPAAGGFVKSGGGKETAKMWDCRCRLHGRHFILARDAQAAHVIALSQGLRPDAMFPLPAHVQPVFGEQTCIKA